MWHTLHPTISIKKKRMALCNFSEAASETLHVFLRWRPGGAQQTVHSKWFLLRYSAGVTQNYEVVVLFIFEEQLIANFKRSTSEHIWLICFAWDQISHWVGIFRGVVVWEVPRLIPKSSHPKKCNVNFIDSCPNCEILFSRRKQSIVPLITKKVILIYFIFVLLFNYLQFVFSFAPSGLPRVQPTYTQLRGRSGTQGETLKRKPLKKQ